MNVDFRKETPESFRRTLVQIQLAGVLCLTFWALALFLLGTWEPDPYAEAWRLIVGQLLVGRAYSVSAGLKHGFPKFFLLAQCSLQDMVILLVLYPIIVGGYRRIVEYRFLGDALANIRATAERHKESVAKYGVVGLVAFVFFPLWSTGALAGGVIGYLLGMRTRDVFSAVIVGNFLSVACWLWLFDQMRRFSEVFGDIIPGLILFTALGVAAFMRFYRFRSGSDRKNGPFP
ncbi:MAG TPA: small multi-drug export protein [Candidatus Hydrogenedentes bacterium]|nr:small multi-drug export protein [Candidatus Hydrogenedentota bacterium]HOL76272.1 small multi-drug export protein [Candidatus Hydrogenedentota bacterium]HPO86099.1 small multi-drug export protein [Candidatus Hydrogenedentota bacterium]